MNESLKKSIIERFQKRVHSIAFAPVDRFQAAPERHHPSQICKDAETVIVFGKVVPKGVLNSPQYSLYLLHRSYHTVYPYLDEVGMELANWLDAQGYWAVQIPSYAPLVYHEMEPWGILSLKHAAVAAGIGAFGRNGLVYHPRYGALLRFGAVVTNAKMPGDPQVMATPCPMECHACQESCPSGAFQKDSFQKLTCMTYAIRHAIYPLALREEIGRKNIETIINTAGYNSWVRCFECLRVCPLNKQVISGPAGGNLLKT